MILYPELLLVSTTLLTVLLCGCLKSERFVLITVVGLLVSAMAVLLNGQGSDTLWRVDGLTQLSQLLVLLLSGWIAYYGRNTFPKNSAPYIYILLMMATIGALVVIAANSWPLFYVGLELMALPTYALCVIEKTHPTASEASLKYFVMGVIASIFILYGISFIYLVSADMSYISLIAVDSSMRWYLSIGSVFLLSGILFKLGVAPFHMWVPDIYESAPIMVVNWIAVVPKIAMMSALVRILSVTGLNQVPVVTQVFMLSALLSIGYGVLMATQQKNLRRLIGYASISHMGFVMLPLSLPTQTGMSSAFVYLVGYVLITTTAFSVLIAFSQRGVVKLADLQGMARVLPHEAYTLLLSLAAMAGIPPLVGFMIKLNVFNELIVAGHIKSVIWAVSFVAISGYYYMSMVRHMFFNETVQSEVLGGKGLKEASETLVSSGSNYAVLAWGLGLIILGILPQSLLFQLTQVVNSVVVS